MKPIPLNESELALVGRNSDEIVLLEILKGMTVEELLSFGVYTPLCMKHYATTQMKWIEKERELLCWRAGRIVDEGELIEDMKHTHNPERFRAYYVLKYPQFVVRIAVQCEDGTCNRC